VAWLPELARFLHHCKQVPDFSTRAGADRDRRRYGVPRETKFQRCTRPIMEALKMSYREYADHIENQAASIPVEDAFHVAPTDHWELSDFDDILPSV